MATRLTSFSKFLITIIILGVIVGAGWYILNKTSLGAKLKEDSAQTTSSDFNKSPSDPKNTSSTDDVLDVQLVTWGGYAPGLYFNEGAEPSEKSRFYKDYGLKVRFHKNDDLGNALNAWISGDYDVLVQTADAFPLYTSPDDIWALKPQVIMQVRSRQRPGHAPLRLSREERPPHPSRSRRGGPPGSGAMRPDPPARRGGA
jgi:hypothetical protein